MDEKKTEAASAVTSSSDGVFQVSVAPQTESSNDGVFSVTMTSNPTAGGEPESVVSYAARPSVFMPRPRMNTLLAVKHGILYLYGGMVEDGDKQITLSDMYALDLHKLDEWKTIIELDEKLLEWHESDSSDDDSDEEGASKSKGKKRRHETETEDDDDDDEDDDSDDESDMDDEDIPDINEGESFEEFFGRTQDFWIEEAQELAKEEKIQTTEKKIKKVAQKMC